MKVVYLIGEPGIGKTTLTREVVRRLGFPAVEQSKPVPHITYPNNALQLGRDRVDFGGTDALSMSVQPRALEFLRSKPAALVVIEGDRLGNRTFFMEVGRFADLRVVWLLDPEGKLGAERREQRAKAVGKTQNKDWVLSRVRKVANLADMVNLRIDARLPLEQQAEEMWREMSR